MVFGHAHCISPKNVSLTQRESMADSVDRVHRRFRRYYTVYDRENLQVESVDSSTASRWVAFGRELLGGGHRK